jgi:uncharacterized protein YyaL (SSP411 family)
MSAYPSAYTGLLCADVYLRHGGMNIVLAAGAGIAELLKAAQGFNPFATLSLCGDTYNEIYTLSPHMKDCIPLQGRAAAYICAAGSCLPPVTDPAAVSRYFAM